MWQPTSQPRPCWHCHWFGFLRAGNGNCFCINPKLSPITAVPRDGCAFWRREPGADDRMRPPEEIDEDSPEGLTIRQRRARLERIREIAQRQARLPPTCYVEVGDASGVLVADCGSLSQHRLPAAQDAIEALGIQKAVRAGKA